MTLNNKQKAVLFAVGESKRVTSDVIFRRLPKHYRHGGRSALIRCLRELKKAGLVNSIYWVNTFNPVVEWWLVTRSEAVLSESGVA